MLLKYCGQDIVDAIAEVLFEDKEGRLNYTKLYNKVNDKLRHQRESHKGISLRDFDTQRTIMVDKNRLNREEQYHPNIRRTQMPKVYYSLTANAKKEHLFGILGNDPIKKTRRKLYHLLFFLQAFSPIRYDDVLSEERLDRALSRIKKSRKDLILERSGHMYGTNYSYVTYRSIQHAKIFRDEYSGLGPDKLQTRFHYNYRLESFSLKEAKSYLTKSQIHNNNLPSGDDDNNNNAAVIRLRPFVNGIYFTGEEMTIATEEELGKVFNILQKNDLIQPTINWLSDDDDENNNNKSEEKDDDDNTRFIFTDRRLRELIRDIWVIQSLQLDILRDKINYLSEKPNWDEIQMLVRLYGQREADRIIHHVYSSSRSRRKSSKHGKEKESGGREKEKETVVAAEEIENDKKMVRGLIKQVNERYGKVIYDEYKFPPALLDGVCLEKIFTYRE